MHHIVRRFLKTALEVQFSLEHEIRSVPVSQCIIPRPLVPGLT